MTTVDNNEPMSKKLNISIWGMLYYIVAYLFLDWQKAMVLMDTGMVYFIKHSEGMLRVIKVEFIGWCWENVQALFNKAWKEYQTWKWTTEDLTKKGVYGYLWQLQNAVHTYEVNKKAIMREMKKAAEAAKSPKNNWQRNRNYHN